MARVAGKSVVNARSRRTAVKLDNVKREDFPQHTTALGVGALVLGEPLAGR